MNVTLLIIWVNFLVNFVLFLDNFGLLLKLPTLLETFVHTYAILFKARVGVNVHLSKAYKGFFANKLYQVLRPIEKNDDFT